MSSRLPVMLRTSSTAAELWRCSGHGSRSFQPIRRRLRRATARKQRGTLRVSRAPQGVHRGWLPSQGQDSQYQEGCPGSIGHRLLVPGTPDASPVSGRGLGPGCRSSSRRLFPGGEKTGRASRADQAQARCPGPFPSERIIFATPSLNAQPLTQLGSPLRGVAIRLVQRSGREPAAPGSVGSSFAEVFKGD